MEIKLPCELVQVVPVSFKNKDGEKVDFFKALFISSGEVFDVNFTGDDNYKLLKERERKLLEYTFILRKNNYGAFKIALPVN